MSNVASWLGTAIVGLLIESCGHAHAEQSNSGFGESICVVDMAPFHVSSACNILKLEGISAGAMGSRGFGIFVQKKDVLKASSILAADAKVHPMRYTYIVGYKGELGVPKKPKWKKIKFNVDVDKLNESKVLRANPLLRGFARDGAKQMKTIVSGKVILREIWFLPMDYVDDKGKLQIAIEAVAKFGYKGKSEEFQAGGWTWNLGRDSFIQNSGGEIP